MREPNVEFIRKVLDLSEVQSFEWDDSPVNIGPSIKDATVMWANPIPVLGDGGARIGFATLWRDKWDSGDLFADLFLTRETPERLDLQSNVRPLYLFLHDEASTYNGDKLITMQIKMLKLSAFKHKTNFHLAEPTPVR